MIFWLLDWLVASKFTGGYWAGRWARPTLALYVGGMVPVPAAIDTEKQRKIQFRETLSFLNNQFKNSMLNDVMAPSVAISQKTLTSALCFPASGSVFWLARVASFSSVVFACSFPTYGNHTRSTHRDCFLAHRTHTKMFFVISVISALGGTKDKEAQHLTCLQCSKSRNLLHVKLEPR